MAWGGEVGGDVQTSVKVRKVLHILRPSSAFYGRAGKRALQDSRQEVMQAWASVSASFMEQDGWIYHEGGKNTFLANKLMRVSKHRNILKPVYFCCPQKSPEVAGCIYFKQIAGHSLTDLSWLLEAVMDLRTSCLRPLDSVSHDFLSPRRSFTSHNEMKWSAWCSLAARFTHELHPWAFERVCVGVSSNLPKEKCIQWLTAQCEKLHSNL